MYFPGGPHRSRVDGWTCGPQHSQKAIAACPVCEASRWSKPRVSGVCGFACAHVLPPVSHSAQLWTEQIGDLGGAGYASAPCSGCRIVAAVMFRLLVLLPATASWGAASPSIRSAPLLFRSSVSPFRLLHLLLFPDLVCIVSSGIGFVVRYLGLGSVWCFSSNDITGLGFGFCIDVASVLHLFWRAPCTVEESG